MGVSENNGTPKSSILIVNRVFHYKPSTIFGNTYIYIYILVYQGPLTKLGHRTWEWLAASHLLSLGGVCGILIGRLMNSNKNSLLFFGGVRFGSIVLYPCHGKKAQALKRGWSYVTAENAWHLANHRRNCRARELSINSLRNLLLPCPEGWSIVVICAWNAFIAIPKKWGVFIHESHGLMLHARHCYTTSTCFSTKGPWFFYTQPVSERSGHARDFSRRSARGTRLGEKITIRGTILYLFRSIPCRAVWLQ